jgi:hypothetical protein
MSAHDDGGPAFPFVSHGGASEHQWCSGGMSLRDYFIAHAPAEPQPWFRPEMPEAPRQVHLRDAPQAVRDELQTSEYEDWLSESEMSPAAAEWHRTRKAAEMAVRAWTTEHNKQQYVQWPAAWADAMLKARSA